MTRSHVIAVIGLLVLAIAVILSQVLSVSDEEMAPTTPSPPTSESTGSALGVIGENAEPVIPSFDVVRINPEGDAVIAGRAMAKADVTILDGEAAIGRVFADQRGEWVWVPEGPLAPGNHVLSLHALNPDGTEARSAEPVILVVPERNDGSAGGALAMKGSADGTILLQAPVEGDGLGRVTISVVDQAPDGRFSVGGKAPSGSAIQLYLEDQPVGKAVAEPNGNWRVAPSQLLGEGEQRVRADELDADGAVVARAEVIVSRGRPAVSAGGSVMVVKGESLWRIARRAYGSGFDYAIIFQANRSQIRDPDLIYPGQVFDLPTR